MDNRFNEDGLALSGNYAETMNGVVMPALAKIRKDQTLSGAGGKPLFVSRFDAENPRGTILVLHGFTENADKFAELIYSLLQNRWSVLAYDQRGHGRSWRPEGLKDNSLTHVDRFSEYIRDLEIVCQQVLKKMPAPYGIFAHSMGGAVAARFLELHDGEVFSRAVLCAPMIACQRGGLPYFVGKAMCRGMKMIGKGKERIFMFKPFAGPEDFATSCASGRERFDWYDALRVATPEFQNNSPSYSWTLNALGISQKLLFPGAAEKITIPVMLYGAEDDNQVIPKAQEMFIRRLKKGKMKVVPGSKHEIYRSPDAVLFPWWKEILGFFAEGNAK